MSKTILIVDDSASMRNMVSFTLKGAGYAVVEAADGTSALTKAQFTRVDLVLTDQNMPGMDGIAFVKALRALPTYKSTTILMLTTESGESVKAMGKGAGLTGWLVKPFDPAKLQDVVKKLIS
jgi:two-component system chemotaxis response regulator CheY